MIKSRVFFMDVSEQEDYSSGDEDDDQDYNASIRVRQMSQEG